MTVTEEQFDTIARLAQQFTSAGHPAAGLGLKLTLLLARDLVVYGGFRPDQADSMESRRDREEDDIDAKIEAAKAAAFLADNKPIKPAP